MFRIILLVICGMNTVANIIWMIKEEEVSSRFVRFATVVFHGSIFYYIWIT